MWQNRNKIGAAVGGVDLINYSELDHPMSHHSIACGRDKLVVFPTDLVGARTNVEFIQQGFYAKEAMKMTNSLAPDALRVPEDT